MARAVVIGGGVAGIAAARTLHDAGQEVLLVEASDCLGGRAHSLPLASLFPREGGGPAWTPAFPGEHVDVGCGWLHSAQRNPWTEIAETTGFTVDRSDANWRTQWRDLGFPPEDQSASATAYQDWNERALAALEGPDRPLSDFIAPNDKWRPKIDAISGYANGANLTQVSLHDWAAYEEAATDDNWTVKEGYGTLVASRAAGLNIRLSTPVTRIDRSGRRLQLDTPAGTIERTT